MIDDLEFRIAKLEMKPGDVLVAKFDCKLGPDARNIVTGIIDDVVPKGTRYLILERGADLSVLTFDEIHSRIIETVPNGARDA